MKPLPPCGLTGSEAERVLLTAVEGDLRRHTGNLVGRRRKVRDAARVLAEPLEEPGVFLLFSRLAEQPDRVDDGIRSLRERENLRVLPPADVVAAVAHDDEGV